jgi:hypothetical protein
MAKYTLYCPQLPAGYRELTKRQAYLNYDHFIVEMPHRIALLRAMLALDGIDVDVSGGESHLLKIAPWLEQNVGTRDKSPQELAFQQDQMPDWAKDRALRWELDDVTLSLCFDVGMFFGELLRHQKPKLEWSLFRGNRAYSDYNCPVIETENERLEPVFLVRQQVYGIFQLRERLEDSFRKIYSYWSCVL